LHWVGYDFSDELIDDVLLLTLDFSTLNSMTDTGNWSFVEQFAATKEVFPQFKRVNAQNHSKILECSVNSVVGTN